MSLIDNIVFLFHDILKITIFKKTNSFKSNKVIIMNKSFIFVFCMAMLVFSQSTLAVGINDRVDRRMDHRDNASDRVDDKQEFREERRDCTGEGADCRSDNRQDKRHDTVDRTEERIDDRQDRRF